MALMNFQAVQPGIAGNRILINMIPVSGGPVLSIVVTNRGLNIWEIEISYGFTPGSPDRLVSGTWSTLADGINADPDAGALVVASGDTDNVLNGQVGQNWLQDGFTGQRQT